MYYGMTKVKARCEERGSSLRANMFDVKSPCTAKKKKKTLGTSNVFYFTMLLTDFELAG